MKGTEKMPVNIFYIYPEKPQENFSEVIVNIFANAHGCIQLVGIGNPLTNYQSIEANFCGHKSAVWPNG